MALLHAIAPGLISCAFFDPQYRPDSGKRKYGNEDGGKLKAGAALPQMDDETMNAMVFAIEETLKPSGHLFLWTNKERLCDGEAMRWQGESGLSMVDMIVWDKDRFGMGYRSRRQCEFLLVLQKDERRAKGVWKDNAIPDVWRESVERGGHPHRKPAGLTRRLVECVTEPGEAVLDPAAGSFSVMEAAHSCGRHFIGCDVSPEFTEGN